MTAPRFEAVPPAAGPRVQGFSGRRFLVDGKAYAGLLLTPRAARDWTPPALAALDAAALEAELGLDPPPEFLLLGTGAAMAFPPHAFRQGMEALGIGVEAMDSRAAARTWGLLRGEGRWIAAALMPL
jgi:uncharacterized protein